MPSVLVMHSKNFNPRSPHGERLVRPRVLQREVLFQSTLPAWGATRAVYPLHHVECAISIHAPRMGSDMSSPLVRMPSSDFNPRSPHGERLHAIVHVDAATQFQSTLPAWGATDQ